MSIYQRDGDQNDVRSIATIDYDRIARRLNAYYTAIYAHNAGRTLLTDAELRDLGDRLMDMQRQVLTLWGVIHTQHNEAVLVQDSQTCKNKCVLSKAWFLYTVRDYGGEAIDVQRHLGIHS